MSWAALRLFAATGSDAYLDHATRWTDVLDRHYWDQDGGGYFTSADDTSDVVVRLKSGIDDAVPNGNAIQLSNLIALTALTGDVRYDTRARALVNGFAAASGQAPIAYCGLLAAELDLDRLVQIAVGVTSGTDLRDALMKLSVPGALEFVGKAGAAGSRSLLAGKTAEEGKSTAYVCVGQVCSAPIGDPGSLARRLREARTGTAEFR
jgi:uncharacterized protein YyaL (SSP411 family)